MNIHIDAIHTIMDNPENKTYKEQHYMIIR